MTGLFRLIRLPNLLIIALTLYGVRYGLLEPVWRHTIGDMLYHGFMVRGLGLHMSNLDFGLLVFSILCISAAGYIINDYFDTRIDRINKPDQVIVGRIIKRRVAMVMHLTLSSIGLLLGIYLSLKVGNWKLSGIHLFSIIALWFYSTHLKKQMLAGNLLISLLAALVPITAGLYEFSSGSIINLNILNEYVPGMGNSLLRKGAFLVIGYAAFAFLSNLAREIIKDIEDMEGDSADGARTLPLVLGETQARFVAISVIVFTMILLGLIQKYLWLGDYQSMFWYILAAVQLPFLVLLVQTWMAQEKKAYSRASLLCKVLIITGVVSMFVFRFTY